MNDTHSVVQDNMGNTYSVPKNKIIDDCGNESRLVGIGQDPYCIVTYSSTIIIGILFIAVFIAGSQSDWYKNLKKPSTGIWSAIVMWVAGLISAYISIPVLWVNSVHDRSGCSTHNSVVTDSISKILSISGFFLVGIFLLLAWVLLLYYGQDIGLSLWMIAFIFTYEFWLFMYIWYMSPESALFLIPLLLVCIYMMYYIAHLAYLNNVPL